MYLATYPDLKIICENVRKTSYSPFFIIFPKIADLCDVVVCRASIFEYKDKEVTIDLMQY